MKVKKDGGDSCLLVEQEGKEVEGVIMVGVKIVAKVSLVGEGEWVLVKGNYVSWKIIWGVT